MERPFPDFLSHPDHVIPAAEFISALFKAAQGFESKASVKKGTVFGKEGVLLFCDGKAGIEVEYLLGKEDGLQLAIECLPYAPVMERRSYIDRKFCGVVIGFPGVEGSGIGISCYPAIGKGGKIGVPFQGRGDTMLEIFQRRRVFFKGNRRVFHIGPVNGKKGRRIFYGRLANKKGRATGSFHFFVPLFP
jgi:hypothetical protein